MAIYRTIGAANGLGVHWGTFQLSAEGFDAPAEALARDAASACIEPGRFRTMTPGEAWDVPAL